MRSAPTTSSSAPRRILVRIPNWVGDVLMATPALRALRQAWPAAEITLLGPRVAGELLAGLPHFDAFLPDPGRGLRAALALAATLRTQGFDLAVLLPDSLRVALAPFLARIPARVGYARDPARRLLLTQALDPPREQGQRVPISMIERFLRVTRAAGCPDAGPELDLAVCAEARESLASRLAREGIRDEEELLVVTPGASFGASKLWPPRSFATACDRLAKERGLVPVLAPGPGEEEIAREIGAAMQSRSVNLAEPPTSLRELAALIERGRLLLTNDTGPRHMAVALDRPVVTVLGPTDRRHTDHLLERQRVLREPVDCSPCHLKVCPIDHRCMTRLEPERVVRAALELLE